MRVAGYMGSGALCGVLLLSFNSGFQGSACPLFLPDPEEQVSGNNPRQQRAATQERRAVGWVQLRRLQGAGDRPQRLRISPAPTGVPHWLRVCALGTLRGAR